MESKKALEKQHQPAHPGPIFVEAERLFDQMKEFSQAVARRAYSFFEERGREFGHDVEDWLRAEFELTRPIPAELMEKDGQIIIRSEVPGFSAENIKISVEPNLVILSGKFEKEKEEETEKKVFSEFRANQFYRRLNLPAEVDPAKSVATLKDGILELDLTKLEKSEGVNVEIKAA